VTCYDDRVDAIAGNRIREVLRRELPGLEEAVPLAPLCAYGVGGPAQFLFRALTTGTLVHAVLTARELGLPVTVLGRCTNVLVGDAGIAGLVVLARTEGSTLDNELLRVEAGAELPGLIGDLAGQGLAGLEFAANIPGSVGGAVVGNAGAYGSSVSDALVAVHLLEDGKEHIVEPAWLDFGYRTSLLKLRPDIVVLSASFMLRHGRRGALLAQIARDAELRRSKHPLENASCGSFFKNPSRELPAARLIEDAGLKGLAVGKAHVSAKHANFLVAEPGATAADIVALAAEIRRRVREQSGYELVEEVRRLGFA
jgi:UDP-N-acetylmuramate dehydrogenase